MQGGAQSQGNRQDEDVFTIKQVADLFQSSRGAIRFFQEKGLVEPSVAENGYRHYTLDDIFQLLYLRRFASMSIALNEVAERFRWQSADYLADVDAFLDDRAQTLRARISSEIRQLRALADYRQTLADARDGAVRLRSVGECWILDRSRIAAMLREDPETLRRLVALVPSTFIGASYNLEAPESFEGADLRIDAKTAVGSGLQKSHFFRVAPPTLLAQRTVRCTQVPPEDQALKAILLLADEMRERGYRPGTSAFSVLMLIHTEEGGPAGYHAICLPLEK